MPQSLSFTCINCKNSELEEIREQRQAVLIEDMFARGLQYSARGPVELASVISHYRCTNCKLPVVGEHGKPIADPDSLINHLNR